MLRSDSDVMGLIQADTFNKYFTLILLTCINLLNYMDRFTIAGILLQLQDTSRSGFHLNGKKEAVDDTMGGLLQTAFIASYMLLSPVFGYLGDRYTRKYIIFVGILLWSAFTLTGSFSVNFWMLFGTRLLVGVGEASYATIAPTMIADLFPSNKRLRMLAIFYIAMPVGSALGYITGSQVSKLVHSFFHQPDSWRWALRVTPALGVIAALLILFLIKEPVRGVSEGQRKSTGVKGAKGFFGYIGDLLYLMKNKTFLASTAGFTAVTYTTGALAQWAPAFITRISCSIPNSPCYQQSTAALIFGAMTVTAGIFGTVIGSELAKFLNRYTRKAEAIVCSVSMLVATPFLYLSLTVVQYKILYVSYVTVFLAILFACLNWTPVSAMLLYSIVPERRATASAVQILFSHLLGDAISPLIVGAISDAVFRYSGPALGFNAGKALSTEFGLFTTAIVMVLGGGAFLIATLTVENDRKAVEQHTKKKNVQQNDRSSSDDIVTAITDKDADYEERKELLTGALDIKYHSE